MSNPRSAVKTTTAFVQRNAPRLAVVVLVMAGASFAQAASLRCDKALLALGAHMYEVSQRCGAPVAEYSRLEYRHPDVAVYVDEWIYRPGKNKFERMLRFENGRLRSIRTLRKPVTPPAPDAGKVHRISY